MVMQIVWGKRGALWSRWKWRIGPVILAIDGTLYSFKCEVTVFDFDKTEGLWFQFIWQHS